MKGKGIIGLLVLLVAAAIAWFSSDADLSLPGIGEKGPDRPEVGTERDDGSGGGLLSLHFSNTYRNDPTIGAGDPANIDRHLLELIDKAQGSIDAALFELDADPIADRLIAAHRRGLRVRLVLEEEYDRTPQAERVRDAGIPIVLDTRSALMHNKFFVIDHGSVWTGSMNATENGSTRNNNNGILIRSPEIAENYAAEFAEMFELGSFGPRSPSATPNTLVRLPEADIYNYFGPEDDLRSKVLRYLRLAKKEIRFMAFSFTDDEVGQMMVERYRDGIDVAGVIEKRASSLESSEYGRMREAGIPVMTDANRYLMHHKVIVVDRTWTILGSVNFSASGFDRNDENLLIIKSPTLARTMLEEYDRVAAMEPVE